MRMHHASGLLLPSLPRRRFVQGLAAGGVIAGLGLGGIAPSSAAAGATALGTAPVLRGTEFDLVIGETPVNFTGKLAMATTINGMLPGPTLRWREGDTVTLRVTNRLREATSIHWHGILLPFQMDGVPGISFHGIAPGETFTYRFQVRQSGSYWYHSHSGFQEMTGVYGGLIIDPAGRRPDPRRPRLHRAARRLDRRGPDADPLQAQDPERLLQLPSAHGGGFLPRCRQRRLAGCARQAPHVEPDADEPDRSGGPVRGNADPPHQRHHAGGQLDRPVLAGETVRLRFINGAGNTFYDVRIPGSSSRWCRSTGRTSNRSRSTNSASVRARPATCWWRPRTTPIRSSASRWTAPGYARGTLAVRPGMPAAVPAPDKPQWLTMTDMMGDMGGMAGMSGMDHGGMTMMDAGDITPMAPMDTGGMTMMDGTSGTDDLRVPGKKVRHARTEYGPGTDMRVDTPRTNLDDPGIGLRGNGRRVLVLADQHTIGGPLDRRGPRREVEMHLTGNMERYTWSIDGVEYGRSTPIHFRHGERLRVILHNDTMMTHPMHLHGMWSELEAPDGRFLARRHTLPVQPAQRISFLVTADALGRWAWHCHLMLHMDAGMFREAVVS
ncbi:Copper resistance protein A (plasmid) [Ralstonia syzygii]